MKTVIETSNRDYISEAKLSVIKNDKGEINWQDAENNMAYCKRDVMRFTFHEFIHEGENATLTRITITAGDILKLADFIKEQAEIVTSEFID